MPGGEAINVMNLLPAQSAGVPPDERARHDRVLLLAIVNACKMIGE
jgi:hypothetical protein